MEVAAAWLAASTAGRLLAAAAAPAAGATLLLPQHTWRRCHAAELLTEQRP
jgi:hypothetical protein